MLKYTTTQPEWTLKGHCNLDPHFGLSLHVAYVSISARRHNGAFTYYFCMNYIYCETEYIIVSGDRCSMEELLYESRHQEVLIRGLYCGLHSLHCSFTCSDSLTSHWRVCFTVHVTSSLFNLSVRIQDTGNICWLVIGQCYVIGHLLHWPAQLRVCSHPGMSV